MRRMLQARARAVLSFIVGLAAGACWLGSVSAQSPQRPAEAADATQARPAAIRFLTDSDYPPFNYIDEENSLTGFNVDMARAICTELAAVCDIKTRPWAELLPALQRKEADAVIASHTLTAGALKGVDFTDRYYHTPARFAGKRTLTRIDVTPEGLEGRRIGVARGTAHEAYLRIFFRDSAIRTFETVELARDAVLTGAVDLLFDDGISLAFWLNGTASKACCEYKGGPFTEPKFFGDGVGIAVAREDARLKRLINGALRKLRDNGRYEEIVLRYFPLRAF